MKKYLAIIPAILGAGLVVYSLIADEVVISIPEATIQEQVADALPVRIQHHTGMDMQLYHATIDFREGRDTARITFDMDVSGYGMEGVVSGDADSSLRYEDGNFYLSNFKVVDIDLTPTADTQAQMDVTKATASKLFKKFLDGASEENKAKAEKFKEDAVLTIKEIGTATAIRTIQSVPVYALDQSNIVMRIASTAIKDISFTETSVEVALDPGSMKLMLFGLALILLAAVLFWVGYSRNAQD